MFRRYLQNRLPETSFFHAITYLREEVKAEALVRNLQAFQNFLGVAVDQYSEQINFSAVLRDCQVAFATVREYYSIL